MSFLDKLERVFGRFAIPNLSIYLVIGQVFVLLAGTVLVEQIFAWPGIGSYAYRAASTLDLSAIVGVTIFVALIYIVVNFITDVLYGIIDPRIRRA